MINIKPSTSVLIILPNPAKPETPKTMNLMPGIEIYHGDDESEPRIASPGKKSHEISKDELKVGQMTIFFGGKIVVFDNFPVEKANELMIMAKNSCPPPNPIPLIESSPTVLPQPSTSDPATSPAAAAEQSSLKPSASDLPIARRVSLNRFLEKRKDRITSKAPYPANGKAEEGEKWLGLAAPPPGLLRFNGWVYGGELKMQRTGYRWMLCFLLMDPPVACGFGLIQCHYCVSVFEGRERQIAGTVAFCLFLYLGSLTGDFSGSLGG